MKNQKTSQPFSACHVHRRMDELHGVPQQARGCHGHGVHCAEIPDVPRSSYMIFDGQLTINRISTIINHQNMVNMVNELMVNNGTYQPSLTIKTLVNHQLTIIYQCMICAVRGGCRYGGFHSHGDTPIAGWFLLGKVPSTNG